MTPPDETPVDAERPATDATLAELAVLRCHLRGASPDALGAAHAAFADARARLDGPTGLDRVADACGLSPFERAVLLLACGPDLVGAVATELADRTGVPHLTFSTALAALPDAHWSALTPASGLRRWLLVTPDDPTRVVTSRLVVDERILHLVAGVDDPDERVVDASRVAEVPAALPRSWTACALDLAEAWASGPVCLVGVREPDARAIAAVAAQRTGRTLRVLPAADLPAPPDALRALARQCAREALLGPAAFWVQRGDADDEVVGRLERAFADATQVAFAAESASGHGVRTLEVARPPLAERAQSLRGTLAAHGAATDAATVTALASAFDPTPDDARALGLAVAAGEGPWAAARRVTRVAAPGARRVAPRATWEDLVLPDTQVTQLRALAASVRHRALVLDGWGFGARGEHGVGTSALFAGPSGTGKTFAAEVIAGALGRDLLVVDLSQVVSKYIGETEKHLAHLFDAAERTGAVLVFDESDALFGKRTEVRDSHDRYANIEVAYLLQRLERYEGLAILTSNARSGIDQAFLRRLTSIVTFPHPDAAARLELWRRAFPDPMPRGDLDTAVLMTVDATGATIMAAALAAAYLAADAGEPVGTRHVLLALQWELAKEGRPLGVAAKAGGRG